MLETYCLKYMYIPFFGAILGCAALVGGVFLLRLSQDCTAQLGFARQRSTDSTRKLKVEKI